MNWAEYFLERRATLTHWLPHSSSIIISHPPPHTLPKILLSNSFPIKKYLLFTYYNKPFPGRSKKYQVIQTKKYLYLLTTTKLFLADLKNIPLLNKTIQIFFQSYRLYNEKKMFNEYKKHLEIESQICTSITQYISHYTRNQPKKRLFLELPCQS